jgi:putative sugar O-methyltransferase
MRSDLWSDKDFQKESDEFNVNLSNWRKEGRIASMLCVRNPDNENNGRRYLLTLLMDLLYLSEPSDKDLYHKINNRNFGNPYAVKHFETEIDYDYYYSIQEYKTLKTHVSLEKKTVLEIGAGYGRLCHSFLSLETIEKYIIVDLPETLYISKIYLKAVLSEELFRKITFVDALNEFSYFFEDVDIVINVASMNEMLAEVVDNYLKWIDKHSKYFYGINPVGKYHPSGIYQNKNCFEEFNVKNAVNVGPIQEVFDLWDYETIKKLVPKYIDVYKPSGNWEVVHHESSLPWLSLHRVIYKNKK